MKTLTPPVKGTRDFYPEDWPFREWLYGKIKEVSLKFGYQEFDGPVLEYLELYADKTNEEILKEQVFSLKDRDGKDLVLRPEITPTFARMVAQRSQRIPKPIRWWSFGRGWRYEQPQKGRGREFFQWEINILGPENPQADAEIIAIAVEFFKSIGLTSDEVVIKISDRSLFDKFLQENGIADKLKLPIIRIMDHFDKLSLGDFDTKLKDLGLTLEQVTQLHSYISSKDYSQSEWLSGVLKGLMVYPELMEFVEFDPKIFRGFDYYTRTVFEAWDKTGQLKRALFGGGRFDDLTETLGGERLPGVGMAPGDMPIQVVLEQFNKLPTLKPKVAIVLVSVFSEELLDNSLKVSSQLRAAGINTEAWLTPQDKLEKQLKYADSTGIPYVVILGPDEVKKGVVTVKDLTAQSQEQLSLDELISKLSQ